MEYFSYRKRGKKWEICRMVEKLDVGSWMRQAEKIREFNSEKDCIKAYQALIDQQPIHRSTKYPANPTSRKYPKEV